MNDARVISIVVRDGLLYGIATSGHLVVFDNDLNGWVTRGNNEIVDIQTRNKLTMPDMVYPDPMGRHRPVNTDNPKKLHWLIRYDKQITRAAMILGFIAGIAFAYYYNH